MLVQQPRWQQLLKIMGVLDYTTNITHYSTSEAPISTRGERTPPSRHRYYTCKIESFGNLWLTCVFGTLWKISIVIKWGGIRKQKNELEA